MQATTIVPKLNPTPLAEFALSLERRAWVRSACDLEAACHLPALELEVIWPARVENICAGGLGLVVSRRFEAGAVLYIELPSATGPFLPPVAAEVVHVAEHPRGGWRIGCVLNELLAEADLRALLQDGE